MKTILNGIRNENPVFALLLGLCSTLAVTTKFENAYLMGICVLVVLFCSNTVISIIKKLIPESVRIPVYIIIISTFVTILEILLSRYVKPLYDVFGIYLPLIVVNCIVLGRTLNVATKEKVTKSMLDAIGIGLGYMLALMAIAFLREVLGSNTLTLMDATSRLTGYRAVYQILPENMLFPMNFLVSPAGAFLVLGLLMAIWNHKKGGQNESN